MVRRAHGHRVDAFVQFVEHLAEIDEPLGFGMSPSRPFERSLIDIANRHHLPLSRRVGHVAGPLTTNANASEPQPLVGGLGRSFGRESATGESSDARQAGRGQERPTIENVSHIIAGKWMLFDRDPKENALVVPRAMRRLGGQD
jgi:hypothetical protein